MPEVDNELAVDVPEESARYDQLLDRVAGIAQTLGTARDLLSVYRALRAFAFASTPATAIFISLYDAETGLRTAAYGAGPGEEDDVSSLPPMPMTGSPASRAIAEGAAVIVPDFQREMTGRPLMLLGAESDPDVPKSSLAVPMAVMGRVIGAVEVQSTALAAFGHEHATAMRMAANLAAIAVENVRMLEREYEREQQLRQAQKMEAVGRLAGGVAHDFNNLLTVINGYAALLARYAPADGPLQAYVSEIRGAGDRAADLTRQLLAFSRKQVLQPKLMDLNLVVEGLERMLRRLIGEDVTIETVLEPGAGPIVADPGQIEQVVVNLAVNARDAMPSGGTLTITTARATAGAMSVCGAAHGEDYVELRVADTGVGMDADTRGRIFEPFFTTKEQGKGTGLGLSTVYGIVRQSGGCITVDSRPGEGATFAIHFPRASEEAAVAADDGRGEAGHEPGAGTVLLVEDEEALRRLVREILEQQNYTVIEAGHGPEALAAAARHRGRIDLTLTDVVMPGMSGPELAARLAAERPGMKVVYMSGYTDEAIGHHGFGGSGVTLIEKPFSPAALTSCIRRALSGE